MCIYIHLFICTYIFILCISVPSICVIIFCLEVCHQLTMEMHSKPDMIVSHFLNLHNDISCALLIEKMMTYVVLNYDVHSCKYEGGEGAHR